MTQDHQPIGSAAAEQRFDRPAPHAAGHYGAPGVHPYSPAHGHYPHAHYHYGPYPGYHPYPAYPYYPSPYPMPYPLPYPMYPYGSQWGQPQPWSPYPGQPWAGTIGR